MEVGVLVEIVFKYILKSKKMRQYGNYFIIFNNLLYFYSLFSVKTMGSSKIFKSIGNQICCQTCQYEIAANSLFILAFDPIVLFKDANFIQKQLFHFDLEASGIIVDWYTSGRQVISIIVSIDFTSDIDI